MITIPEYSTWIKPWVTLFLRDPIPTNRGSRSLSFLQPRLSTFHPTYRHFPYWTAALFRLLPLLKFPFSLALSRSMCDYGLSSLPDPQAMPPNGATSLPSIHGIPSPLYFFGRKTISRLCKWSFLTSFDNPQIKSILIRSSTRHNIVTVEYMHYMHWDGTQNQLH